MAATAGPSATMPYLLQQAVHEIEQRAKPRYITAASTVKTVLQRIEHASSKLTAGSVGSFQNAAELGRRAALFLEALDHMQKDGLEARLAKETQAFLLRCQTLEQQEAERRKATEDRIRRSEARFLPTVPRQGTRARNFTSQIAQELKYKFGVASRPVDLIMFDTCPKCDVAMQYNVAMQQLICPMRGCGYWRRFADMTSAALAYGEEVEFCKYAYNPLTHLDDTIRNAEAGEAYAVPPEHLEMVMKELFDRGVKPEDNIPISLIREIVYEIPDIKTENTVQIHSRLTGRAPWRFSSFAKDQIRIMFICFDQHYRKYCGERINNLSYPFNTYNFSYLLGYWEMLPALPLLRGPTNLAHHDAIKSRLYTNELDWEYIPTVKLQDDARVVGALKEAGIL